MISSSLFLGFLFVYGALGLKNEYVAFITEAIDEYMDCINQGQQDFLPGRRYEDYFFAASKKLYEFEYIESRKAGPARKRGKDSILEVSTPPLDSLNNNNANVALRFIEKVSVTQRSETESESTVEGHGSVEVGVSILIVSVSVKTTVEGEQVDKTSRLSENTTTQIWDRIQVTPPFTKSITSVKRFQKHMLVPWTVERVVKGYFPIDVAEYSKRNLSDSAVWQKCGSPAPIMLDKQHYIVPYAAFKNDEWEATEDGGLIQTYTEPPSQYEQEYVKFQRRLETLRNDVSVREFCRLLDPKNKIQPVVSDMDEEEGIVEEDKEDIDEEGDNPGKEYNLGLDFSGGDDKKEKPCNKKNPKKCNKKKKANNNGNNGNNNNNNNNNGKKKNRNRKKNRV